MPTFVYMSSCDGCGKCVEICPSDIMHIDPHIRRAYNSEPEMCWECYSCVKYCPENAIDVRSYADFNPLGHSVTVRREPAKGVISWRIRFRDGRVKHFVFPTRTTREDSIPSSRSYPEPARELLEDQVLSHEPDKLMVPSLPKLPPRPSDGRA